MRQLNVDFRSRYYCKCKPGYEMRNNNCVDINECEEMTHSCHKSAKCVNTDGHFECKCSNLHSIELTLNTLKSKGVSSSSKECKNSCLFENNEILDNTQISPRNQPCSVCTCSKGVITCQEPPCDCSNWEESKNRELCCPQCDPKESCQHQELKHVTFKSGEVSSVLYNFPDKWLRNNRYISNLNGFSYNIFLIQKHLLISNLL